MVTNSTNICKTNSHLSPKLIEDNKKKTTTYDVGNPGSGLWHAQQWGGIKPGNRILIPSLNIWSIEYHNVHLELYHRDMNIWIQGLILKSHFYLFFLLIRTIILIDVLMCFGFVYLRLVSCVPYAASVSGLSIVIDLSGFSKVY
jgi:hypothetical protein